MNKKHRQLLLLVCILLGAFIMAGATALAAPPSGVAWFGSGGTSDASNWGSFLQLMTQPEYRVSGANGNPYWNAFLVPVTDPSSANIYGGAINGGVPTFGFCPVPSQCYMVFIQRAPSSSSGSCYVPPPAQNSQDKTGKPNSLW